MPILVVPSATAARLERLAAREDVPSHVREALRTQIVRVPLSGHTPADPSRADAEVRIPHTLLVQVSQWARDDAYTLAYLLRGAQLYHPPRPVYERPKELDASLEAIRRAHEESEYARMVSWTPSQRAPAAPYRLSSEVAPHAVAAEHEAWREARSQLSALVNILLSMGAVATAVWWGAGSRGAIWVRTHH
ncbi:hypothetical protein MCAP1_002189 [Malassezia caprae]|uniref:Uncharacterized protein n=1 Tax=Malassezia caprae TaxID=1381934 RepID=A0AAF0E7W5_9BASI|nr:hypothetical protein MCAP1_002189 [Malassezia caprae]